MQLEVIEKHIPAWLTKGEQIKLICDMTKAYPNIDYYREHATPDLLQGDGWTGLELIPLDTMTKIKVSGLILSNTCDVSPENKRIQPPNLVFSPVVQCAAYETLLSKHCANGEKVSNHMLALRGQSLTNRFYLPKTDLMKDCVALLDDIHTMPLKYYLENTERALKIRLSTAGFYAFVVKLSVHFCRLTDNVKRDGTVAGASAGVQ